VLLVLVVAQLVGLEQTMVLLEQMVVVAVLVDQHTSQHRQVPEMVQLAVLELFQLDIY
jgi:hypothetical protein